MAGWIQSLGLNLSICVVKKWIRISHVSTQEGAMHSPVLYLKYISYTINNVTEQDSAEASARTQDQIYVHKRPQIARSAKTRTHSVYC